MEWGWFAETLPSADEASGLNYFNHQGAIKLQGARPAGLRGPTLKSEPTDTPDPICDLDHLRDERALDFLAEVKRGVGRWAEHHSHDRDNFGLDAVVKITIRRGDLQAPEFNSNSRHSWRCRCARLHTLWRRSNIRAFMAASSLNSRTGSEAPNV